MTQHVVRLLRGDKRNPTRTLDLASGLSTGSIFLRTGGFSPGPGPQHITWSGRSGRRHGQRRISSSRDNVQLSLTVDLTSTTSAGLGHLARKIQQFFLEARLYEEEAEGEKVWLEYRWQDGLDALPAPAFGQFSHYLRVLDGQVPSWPGELHNGALVAGNIEGVVAELTCAPFAEGLQQRAADKCDGPIELTDNGVLVHFYNSALTHDNWSTNPSFGHGTWNNGWSVSNADLNIINETRADFVRSLGSGAHLVNISTSVQQFYQALTLGTGPWNVSCYVRIASGSAPTSSDMEIYINNSAETTTFVQIDDTDWYLAYAQANGSAGSVNYGVEVKAGREVWIDDFQIGLRSPLDAPWPFVAGYKLGCAWSGTAHASYTDCAEPTLRWTLDDELAGEFTAAGWWTPLWAVADIRILEFGVVEYYVDANNYWVVHFDDSNTRFEIEGQRDSVAFSANGSTQSFSYGDHIHIAVRQDTTTLKVYINGSEDISATTAVGMLEGGIFQLGTSQDANYYPSMAAVDGWHIWREALTATQVDALYDSEKPIKDDYGLVGVPPFLWTKDGDGVLDNVDDTNRDNWGVVGGIAGDVEAVAEYHIDPTAGSPPQVYWLGRKATDEMIDAGIFWLELQGTVDANSSGGEYEEIAAGTSDEYFGLSDHITAYRKYLPGRYQYLSRFYVATNTVDVYPAWDVGAIHSDLVHKGDVVSVATNASFLFRDFGDMTFRFPTGKDMPGTGRFLLFVDRTATATVRGDFVMMLPHPCVRASALVSMSFTVGDVLVITDDEAYVYQSPDGYIYYWLERRGDPVTLVPGKYNYIWLIQGEEGETYDVTETAEVKVFVTPRWLLPGGPVA